MGLLIFPLWCPCLSWRGSIVVGLLVFPVWCPCLSWRSSIVVGLLAFPVWCPCLSWRGSIVVGPLVFPVWCPCLSKRGSILVDLLVFTQCDVLASEDSWPSTDTRRIRVSGQRVCSETESSRSCGQYCFSVGFDVWYYSQMLEPWLAVLRKYISI